MLLAKFWNLASTTFAWLLPGWSWIYECAHDSHTGRAKMLLVAFSIGCWQCIDCALLNQNLTANFRTLLSCGVVNQWVYLLGPDILPGFKQWVFPLFIQPRSLNNQDHMNLYCFQHSTGGLWGCNFVAEMNCKGANFRSSIWVYFKESLHMVASICSVILKSMGLIWNAWSLFIERLGTQNKSAAYIAAAEQSCPAASSLLLP